MFGVTLFFILADSPQTAKYLTESERRLLLARLHSQVGFHDELNKEDAILAAKDWKTWAFACFEFCVTTILYSFSIFLPSIIQGAALDQYHLWRHRLI